MAEQAAEGIISFKWNNHKTTFFNVLASLRAKVYSIINIIAIFFLYGSM